MQRVLLPTLLCALLASCEENAAAPAAPASPEEAPVDVPPAIPDPRPQVTFKGDLGETAFHVSDAAINVIATWPQAMNGDWQVLEVEMPHGALYLREQVKLGDDGKAVWRMPLRGTVVEDYGVTGVWKARFFKNSARAPAHEVSFEIQP